MSFANKVVLITGGSSGIGAATAVAFAREGADVAIVGRNEEKLNRVVEKCTSAGKKPLSITADITHEGQAERIVKETIEVFGKVDVLVNNAGLAKTAKILDTHIMESYDVVMNTNIRSHIQMTNLVAPYLIETKGNIVNVSSVYSQSKPNDTVNVMYAISKAALDRFSIAAAAELAPDGVRVNAVSPGPTDTDILENAGYAAKTFSFLEPLMPLKRVLEPEEVADVILFLAGDKAKGITGSNYIIDNGFLLKY